MSAPEAPCGVCGHAADWHDSRCWYPIPCAGVDVICSCARFVVLVPMGEKP